MTTPRKPNTVIETRSEDGLTIDICIIVHEVSKEVPERLKAYRDQKKREASERAARTGAAHPLGDVTPDAAEKSAG